MPRSWQIFPSVQKASNVLAFRSVLCPLSSVLLASCREHDLKDVQAREMTDTTVTSHEAHTTTSKVCFVTIGATASFDKLLEAVLKKAFLEALHHADYTDVIIQYGKEGGKAIYDRFNATERDYVERYLGIEVTGFDFNTKGLGQEMRRAKGDAQTGSREGLVVSHAGREPTSLPRRT